MRHEFLQRFFSSYRSGGTVEYFECSKRNALRERLIFQTCKQLRTLHDAQTLFELKRKKVRVFFEGVLSFYGKRSVYVPARYVVHESRMWDEYEAVR